jgi:P4 family phage/plasmid primase-like protien
MGDNIVSLAALQDSQEATARSEDAMALMFAERHGDALRYVASWGKWMAFNGVCWQPDSTLHAFDHAREICREAADASGKSGLKSAKTVAAVEKLSRSDRRLAATAEQWDATPMLLTAGDVTFDLESGDGCNPDPLDYGTKKTGCAAAPPGTPHPLWDAFLDRVTDADVDHPNKDNGGLRGFLQRYIGYCLTGLTTEHTFVFAYGTGANGKSTFVNTIAQILDDYATVADMATFITSGSDRHPTDVAKLRGARFVVAQETQKGRRLDEPKIKAITGGDKLTARFMRQDFSDFVPTCKLFICGNHKPRLTGVDEAMRRRLLIAPFTVQIPPAERDKDLPHKLEAEWPAILRWCIDGCLKWQRIGLAPPDNVRAATNTYFAEQDIIKQWMDERTHDGGPFAVTRLSALFESWKEWCEGSNIKPGNSIMLSDELQRRGYEKIREPGTGKTAFRGIAMGGSK